MRRLLAIMLMTTVATPALAQERKRSAPPAVALPPEISDGRMLDELGTMVGALSKVFLDLPIGEVEAAVENRPVTPTDRSKTVRSVTGMDERSLDAEIEQGKGAVKAGGQAIARALPVIVEALNRAGDDIGRATANLPQPGYPRR